MKTVYKLTQQACIQGLPADLLDLLRPLPSVELINEAIIGNVMIAMVQDSHVFVVCDVLKNLCDDFTSETIIEALRNGKFTSDTE